MNHGSLFSGIGGFDLAAEWAGFNNIFNCEIDETCKKLLAYYWPQSIQYGDIIKQDFIQHAGEIDILTGGFPCQPFSNAGEQLGALDARYLFDSMFRAIREIRPRWVVGENVSAIASPKFKEVFEQICTQLEAEGYEVQPVNIPATITGAEHRRERIWFIAYSSSIRLQRSWSDNGQLQPAKIGDRETSRFINSIQGGSMPYVCSSHDGFSRGLAEKTIHAAGNAIVPQIAYSIFNSIKQFEINLQK